MRYFTRGWATGEFTDEEANRIRDVYWQRIRELTSRLPAGVARLANEVQLHDAAIVHVRVNVARRELALHLVCGDLQTGYCDVELSYTGVQMREQQLGVLRDRARDRESAVLYDEVDVECDGEFVHRVLFWPEGEIAIGFREIEIKTAGRESRQIPMMPYFTDEAAKD